MTENDWKLEGGLCERCSLWEGIDLSIPPITRGEICGGVMMYLTYFSHFVDNMKFEFEIHQAVSIDWTA